MPHTFGLGRKPFTTDFRDWPVARVKALIDAGLAVPVKWSVPRILDQGDNGTCVAAGILGLLDCDDELHVDPKFTSADIVPFFLTISGHGDLPEGGAELRDGLKAAKKAGLISAYSLLTSWDQMRDWMENHGPMLTGEDWYSGMDDPDSKGYVTVSGTIRGGHCTYGNGDVSGLNEVNSWNTTYGDKGHFYLTDTERSKLMNGDFEAWAVVEAAPAPVPTPTPAPAVKTTLQVILAALKTCVAALEKLIKSL
jgi:hypothetical protein